MTNGLQPGGPRKLQGHKTSEMSWPFVSKRTSRNVTSMKLADGLLEEPLTISAEWRSRDYVTRVPVTASFTQWTLAFEIDSVVADVLVARVFLSEGAAGFGKDYRSSAGKHQQLGLGIHWQDFGGSDLLTLTFTGVNDLIVEDRDLGLRPHDFVEPTAPSSATTGSAITLARIPHLGVEVQAVCIAKADTANTHGRWKIRDQFLATLPERYAFLGSGAVSGSWTP